MDPNLTGSHHQGTGLENNDKVIRRVMTKLTDQLSSC